MKSAMGSILVNGSPTLEFKFSKGMKQGDPLSPFLFILIMESLHLSFKNVVNAGLYKGIPIDDTLTLSHLFYADDVMFVASAARSIGCSTLYTPFKYLRVKVSKGVLSKIESIRRNFLNGMKNGEKKMSLICWNKILASKKNGAIYGVRGALDNPPSYSRPYMVFIANDKHASVALKLRDNSLSNSFRRSPRSGIEEEQLLLISNTSFADVPTRWVKFIPIKINIFAWRVSLDELPTRLNLSLRGLDIPSIICPLCSIAVESTSHLLFSCQLARQLMLKIGRPPKRRKKSTDELSSQKMTSGGILPRRFAASPISSQWSAATPRATKRSVSTPRTSQRSAATPRTSQRTAATAKGKEKVV
ncbi:RNA-directed DNA polymerase, eukaryota [Tanacetum coccineum]